ncbi:TPA: lpg2527 family Dot/Icm T4SS effector [Legionella pneumophila]|uniref:type IV secretion protein Dot n=1 Tax=Legionella pneumophila TaxID=446 RepID=UPI0009B54D89|nr:type IV secretion protein Dot [Legionella pneumophila]HAU1192763.1 type IV secretion protein Dot [Legionella pneumophila]HBD7102918.1 type IV secretion protein Dot [Legionella pneumophila]HCO4739432.1 type IV secretion protein Dot [Legionella pneumophila]HDU7930274.1 type IV secretion protein Dot [Legionella pneumophila]HDU7936470.1 type IV secretion protein Dot [Legionella pneumophila]
MLYFVLCNLKIGQFSRNPMSYQKIELSISLSLDSPKLDESDFILLSVKYLEKSLGKKREFAGFFEDIERLYFQQNYKEAIEKILDFCKKNESLLSQKVVQRLVEVAPGLKSNPKDNESRRLYETLYADHLESVIKQESDLSVFNELRDSYNAVKPEYAVTHETEIKTLDEAKQFILSFVMLNDNVELPLKARSERYPKKDRSREELGNTPSANPGIMKPNSPNFPDNLVPARDVPKIAINEKVVGGYSKTKPTTPFVASLSGTTYSLMVVLKDYIEKHKTDKDIEKKVNQIINLWISSYIKEGYHSYSEVVDVLTEPFIQSIFDEANIKLNYGVLDETHAEFRKAQDYVFGMTIRSAMHHELLDRFKNKEKLQEEVKNFETVLNKLNQNVENTDRHRETLQKLNEVFQDWSAGKKSYDAFKSESNQLIHDIESEEQKSNRGLGSMLKNLGNYLLYLITFRFLKEDYQKSSSPATMLVTELKDRFEQIDHLHKNSLSLKKVTHPGPKNTSSSDETADVRKSAVDTDKPGKKQDSEAKETLDSEQLDEVQRQDDKSTRLQ